MNRRRLALVALGLLLASPRPSRGAEVEDSVVQVFASLRLPNPLRPWAKQNAVEVMGTGVVLDGKTILTNAHIVLYAGEVSVQARQGGDRFSARVSAIGPDIDLATLTLEDDAFFEKRPPIPRAARRPAGNAAVAVLGFAAGGNGLAVTRGVVSRVDFGPYNEQTSGLRIQVDAAVTQGNSGGPALVDGKMIGLTFRQAQNTGYVIPNEEIDAYLLDVKDGRYDGKPRVTDHFQPLVNDGLRKRLGLARGDRGIMVNRLDNPVPGYPIREGDVLTHLGDTAIDNEGMVDFEAGLRLPFFALVPRQARGGTVAAKVLRDGKPLEVRLPVVVDDDRLIKGYRGRYPPYFVHGPLVFSPALAEALSYYLQNPTAAMDTPLVKRDDDLAAFAGEELVVVTSPLLAHRIARGYGNPFGQVVKDVDGVPVKNLRHLVELLRDGKGEYLTIHFHSAVSETLVFARKAIEETTPDLMTENGIPRRGSPELMAVWDARPAPAR